MTKQESDIIISPLDALVAAETVAEGAFQRLQEEQKEIRAALPSERDGEKLVALRARLDALPTLILAGERALVAAQVEVAEAKLAAEPTGAETRAQCLALHEQIMALQKQHRLMQGEAGLAQSRREQGRRRVIALNTRLADLDARLAGASDPGVVVHDRTGRY